MPLANAGIKDAEVVVDFGDGADGGARVAGRRLLLDADGRRKAAKIVDVGLGKLAEELPGVTGERFHVAALALGIKRVESEGTLARPTDAGEHNQRVVRQFQVDIAKIVFAGAANND